MTRLPEQSSASATKGMWFVFAEGGNKIRAWGSCWTGLERVYFNDEMVAQSFKRDNVYVFRHGRDEFQVDFCTRSVSEGKIQCSLHKNGEPVGMFKSKRRRLLNARPILIHLGASLGIGIGAGYMPIPSWFGWVFVVMSLLITLLANAKTDEFVIENTISSAPS